MLIDITKQVEKLNDIRKGNIVEGLKLGISEIDDHFRFKKGNFNIVLGHANVGKTTMTLYLMLLYTLKHDIKWLVYSSENEPYTLIKKIIEFLEQRPINQIETEIYQERVKWVHSHFRFIDSSELYSYKDLLNFADELSQTFKYDGFMIDPYNSLVKEKEIFKSIGGHEYDYLVASEMRMFCKKHNITIWLNAHAHTEALRKKYAKGHLYEGHPMPPESADIEGGGKFVNRCDDFIVWHRMIYHKFDWVYSLMYVKKIKDIDTGGLPTPIDEPIRFKSLINNVGFEVAGKNYIQKKIYKQGEVPF